MGKISLSWWIWFIIIAISFGFSCSYTQADSFQCKPTSPEGMGPFYKPGAPERSSVGEGYILTGRVKSAGDCSPIQEARIEFWLTGPDGIYDDEHRATVFADDSGSYHFESNFPPEYGTRPPHIHIRVSADGYETLVTQHYPEEGTSGKEFDLVLRPVQTNK